MKPPVFVRPLTDAERQAVQAGVRSSEAFVLRRCQLILASASGERASKLALNLGCDDQTVRNAIRAFDTCGLEALEAGASVPKTLHRAFDESSAEGLRIVLHQSPRNSGKETSVWTLQLAAEVSLEQGLTSERVSDETIRLRLKRLGTSKRSGGGSVPSSGSAVLIPSSCGKKGRRPADEAGCL